MEYIPIEIDVSNLSSSIDKKLEIPKPTGVNSLSVNNITVKIAIANSTNKDVEKVPVNPRNVGEGLAVNISPSAFITVAVSGVEEVISNIDLDVESKNTKKLTKKELAKTMEEIEQEMREAAKSLDFERAMQLRDILFEMKLK